MRSFLGWLAAFTLSSSTAVSAVACGAADQTTVNIFDWNEIASDMKTSNNFFKSLLDNSDNGIGNDLYQDLVGYTSLSILKTNPIFANDYKFASKTIENDIENKQQSLKIKYGNQWEKEWNKFLKSKEAGGDGTTGSLQRYSDSLLKNKAKTIVKDYYVNNNYPNYQYYTSTEINIWLNDIYKNVHPKNKNMDDYINSSNSLYKNKVWIVQKSITGKDPGTKFEELENIIKNAKTINEIKLKYKVPKTLNDQQNSRQFLKDPSNTIKGLLSDPQVEELQVLMRNNNPIWAQQIVIPFNSNSKGIQAEIKIDSFSDNIKKLSKTIKDIKKYGFKAALKIAMNNIASVQDSSQTGDLGLVGLNSDPSGIKTSFLGYLYKYVTSAEGIGQHVNTVIPYHLPEYKDDNNNLEELINMINHTQFIDNNENHTSTYNDLVWMQDGADANKKERNYSGFDRDKVAIFIDSDGIHFVQTPGITYESKQSSDSLQDIIIEYTQKSSGSSQKITFEDVQPLVDRPRGLANNSYLNYLQIQYLLWNANKETIFFDLNAILIDFTSDSNDINSNSWWDYILYFDNNINSIHWNESIQDVTHTKLSANSSNIDYFIKTIKNWLLKEYNRRWNSFQGISNTDKLMKNIKDLNELWDSYGKDAPIARLNSQDLKNYLNNVGNQTIWWYDPNNIQG